MTSLLWVKWNRLKNKIALLQNEILGANLEGGQALTEKQVATMIEIRSLKDEASVIKFAIEDAERTGYTNFEITMRMRANRSLYTQREVSRSFRTQHLHI